MGNVLLPKPSPPGPGESQGDLGWEFQLKQEKMVGNYACLETIPYPPLSKRPLSCAIFLGHQLDLLSPDEDSKYPKSRRICLW